MKEIMKKYRISKFRCFMNGMAFALITVLALSLCLLNISRGTGMNSAILLPFFTAIISIILGVITMFRAGFQQ